MSPTAEERHAIQRAEFALRLPGALRSRREQATATSARDDFERWERALDERSEDVERSLAELHPAVADHEAGVRLQGGPRQGALCALRDWTAAAMLAYRRALAALQHGPERELTVEAELDAVINVGLLVAAATGRRAIGLLRAWHRGRGVDGERQSSASRLLRKAGGATL